MFLDPLGNSPHTRVVDGIKLALYVSVLHLLVTNFSVFLDFGLVFLLNRLKIFWRVVF